MESVDLNNKKEKIIALLDDAEKSGEYSLPVEDFLDVFKKILDDDDLFVKYSNTFAQSMALSVEPESLENFEFDREGYAREITKNIENYLKPAFDAYESASVSEKSKIIEILTLANNKSQSLNTLNFQKYLNSFILEQKKKEEEPDGNYYISTHLDALLSGNERVVEGEIAPQQFVIEKVGERGERTLMFSEKENFEEILALKKEIEEISDKYKKVFNSVEEAGATQDITVNFKDPEDKVGSELQKLGDLFKSKQEYFYSLFEEAPQNFLSLSATDSSSGYFDSRIFFFKSVRDKVSNDVGFDLSSVSLPEQFNFFEYTKNTSNQDISRTFEFTKKYGPTGFRTFLSLEHGGEEMGDKILSLGEKLGEKDAQNLFTIYSNIIDNVDKVVDLIKTNFKKEIKTDSEFIFRVKESLLLKGKELLEKFYENVNSGKTPDILQLDRVNADTITTLTIFKQAIKNGENLPIENIEGSVFSKKEASLITKEQQEEMKKLYENNYANHKDRKFVQKVMDYFDTAFVSASNKSKNHFYLFEKDGKIRAFIRFEKKDDGILYASALNVDDPSKNFGLGEAMMDETLSMEAKDNILSASCIKTNPSNMRYFEKGFVSSGYKTTNNTEELALVWDDAKNKDIVSKQKTKEELVQMGYDEKIHVKTSDNLDDLHSEIPEGKALVRCFRYPDKTGVWYAFYETLPDGYGVNVSEVV